MLVSNKLNRSFTHR